MRVLLMFVVVLILIGACSSSRQVPPADAEHVAKLAQMNEDHYRTR